MSLKPSERSESHASFGRMYSVALMAGGVAGCTSSGLYHWHEYIHNRAKFGDDEIAYLILVPVSVLVLTIYYRNEIAAAATNGIARLSARIAITTEVWIVVVTIIASLAFMFWERPPAQLVWELPLALGYGMLIYTLMAVVAFPLVWVVTMGMVWILRKTCQTSAPVVDDV